MLNKKIILAVAGVVTAAVAYMGYAIYRNYPENELVVPQGVGA